MDDFDIPEFEEFEEDTGFIPPTELDQREELQNKAIVSDGELLTGLKNHPGWKLLEDFMQSEVKSILDAIVTETDIKKIRKMQSMVSSLRLLPAIVDKVLLDADKAKQLIDNNLKDEPDEESANSN